MSVGVPPHGGDGVCISFIYYKMVGKCLKIHQNISWEDASWDEHLFMKRAFWVLNRYQS